MFKFFNFRNNPDIAWNLFDFMLVSMGASCLRPEISQAKQILPTSRAKTGFRWLG